MPQLVDVAQVRVVQLEAKMFNILRPRRPWAIRQANRAGWQIRFLSLGVLWEEHQRDGGLDNAAEDAARTR